MAYAEQVRHTRHNSRRMRYYEKQAASRLRRRHEKRAIQKEVDPPSRNTKGWAD